MWYILHREREKPRLRNMETEKNMSADKTDARRSPRITLRSPVRFQVRGESKYGHSVCENVSSGGMSFTCNRFIAPAATLMLEFNVLSRALMPAGKVVWAQPLPHSDRNRLGIEFVQLDSTEKNYLDDFIGMQTGR